MKSDIDDSGESDAKLSSCDESAERPETESYQAWDDGFRVSMLLLLVIGLPLFLASLYFVLYAVFAR
ncbi:MAG: hypothetical protein ABIR48_08555 [Gammaproteobacteria bacterium]